MQPESRSSGGRTVRPANRDARVAAVDIVITVGLVITAVLTHAWGLLLVAAGWTYVGIHQLRVARIEREHSSAADRPDGQSAAP